MHNNPTPSPSDDDWFERMLWHDLGSEHIDDAGFTARVVHKLPQPNHARRALLLGAALVVGLVVALPLAGPAARELLSAVLVSATTGLDRHPLLPAYVTLGVGLVIAVTATCKALLRTR